MTVSIQNQSGVSILELLQQADIIVQSVMVLLAAASVWSWTIVFDKIFKFYILRIKTSKFEKLFNSEKLLDDIFLTAKKTDDHPFAKIFSAAIQEWKGSNVKSIMQAGFGEKKESLKERIGGTMQVACNKSIEKLDVDVRAMPHVYVTREDYKDDMREVKEMLGKIFDKLDAKQDK